MANVQLRELYFVRTGMAKNTIRLNARRAWPVNVVNVTIEAMTCFKKKTTWTKKLLRQKFSLEFHVKTFRLAVVLFFKNYHE